MPYGPSFFVQKIECRNRLLRNYGTKLAALTKNTKYPIQIRNHIQTNAIRFRNAIVKSIEYRNTLHGQTDTENCLGKYIIYNLQYFYF